MSYIILVNRDISSNKKAKDCYKLINYVSYTNLENHIDHKNLENYASHKSLKTYTGYKSLKSCV